MKSITKYILCLSVLLMATCVGFASNHGTKIAKEPPGIVVAISNNDVNEATVNVTFTLETPVLVWADVFRCSSATFYYFSGKQNARNHNFILVDNYRPEDAERAWLPYKITLYKTPATTTEIRLCNRNNC